MTQRIIFGAAENVLPTLEPESVDLCFTSPPYWGLRDYGEATRRWWNGDPGCDHVACAETLPPRGNRGGSGTDPKESAPPATARGSSCHCGAWYGALGLEPHPAQYIERLVGIFELVRPVLKRSGSLMVNLGDSYYCGRGATQGPDAKRGEAKWHVGIARPQDVAGDGSNWLRPKQLLLIPSRFAVAMQDAGWLLRNDCIWHKKNHMPSSVRDRRSCAYEHVFHFVREGRYWYDLESIRAPLADSSLARISQATFDQQTGGPKDYGHGVNPNMSARKALVNLAHGSRFNTGKTAEHQQGRSSSRERQNSAGANPGDVLVIPTRSFSGAHFAVFPPDLVTPWVKSCCPEKVCAQCGKGWARKTERRCRYDEEPTFVARGEQSWSAGTALKGNPQPGNRNGMPRAGYEDLGVFPSCDCEQRIVPGVVLDPFAGSCTVAEVARGLGRSSICIELNADYRTVIEQRLGLDGELDWGDVIFEAAPAAAEQGELALCVVAAEAQERRT